MFLPDCAPLALPVLVRFKSGGCAIKGESVEHVLQIINLQLSLKVGLGQCQSSSSCPRLLPEHPWSLWVPVGNRSSRQPKLFPPARWGKVPEAHAFPGACPCRAGLGGGRRRSGRPGPAPPWLKGVPPPSGVSEKGSAERAPARSFVQGSGRPQGAMGCCAPPCWGARPLGNVSAPPHRFHLLSAVLGHSLSGEFGLDAIALPPRSRSARLAHSGPRPPPFLTCLLPPWDACRVGRV